MASSSTQRRSAQPENLAALGERCDETERHCYESSKSRAEFLRAADKYSMAMTRSVRERIKQKSIVYPLKLGGWPKRDTLDAAIKREREADARLIEANGDLKLGLITQRQQIDISARSYYHHLVREILQEQIEDFEMHCGRYHRVRKHLLANGYEEVPPEKGRWHDLEAALLLTYGWPDTWLFYLQTMAAVFPEHEHFREALNYKDEDPFADDRRNLRLPPKEYKLRLRRQEPQS